MSEVKPRKNRQHPEAFKQEAVALSYRIGVTKTARQLDIAQSLLYVWRKHYGQTDEAVSSDLVSEHARLKKLLAQKEEELAIVKKAAKYFAQESK